MAIVSYVVLAHFGSIANLLCVIGGGFRPIPVSQLRGEGIVHLVPLDDFPVNDLYDLADHYAAKFDLDVRVAQRLQLPAVAFDLQRAQLEAKRVSSWLRTHPPPSSAPEDTVIGLTQTDMYVAGVPWRYAFSHRSGDHVAVVSSARMRHPFLGIVAVDDATVAVRLRKMLTKNIGVLHYRLPLSGHCRSAVFGRVAGPQELDLMSEEF